MTTSMKTDYPCSMRNCPGSFKPLLVMALALCIAWPVQASSLTAKIAAVKTGAGSLHGVRVSLDWPENASTGTLRIRADTLQFPLLSYQAKAIDWQCPLQRLPDSRWRCAGMIHVAGSGPQRLALDFSPEITDVSLLVGDSRIAYRQLAKSPDLSQLQLKKIPLAWLREFLAGLWAQGRWTSGQLGGSIDVLAPKAGPFEVRSDLHLDNVGLETPDGLLAAAAMKGRMQLQYREKGLAQTVDSQLTVLGGELLFDSFYALFPETPVAIHVLAQRACGSGFTRDCRAINGKLAATDPADTDGAPWLLPKIQWRDPGVLSVDGSASLAADASVTELDLVLAMDDLAVARERYLSGFLAPAGFSELLLTGRIAGRIEKKAGKLVAAQARFDQVNAVDTGARFTFAGVEGDLRWTLADTALPSNLQWQSGALFGIGLGPARYSFSSSGGELRLDRAVSIEALQGRIVLDHLRWQAPDDATGAKFQFGLGMDSLDLTSLSQRLGWPAFTGSIGGKIPSARFQDDILTLDGGLQMNLFGGSVELKDLSMERPFGVAPTLSADVDIQDIDMEPLTRVFGFGDISGRLDGHIGKLRMVDWSPVAFDARLETDSGWKGKRRISQRAVNDISSVGGSGLIGGLQTQVLKFFDDFGYQQIGLGCKLKDNICTMDGVGSAGNGYIIVAGAGLPRIQVVGFRRRVDWPTLVSRLKAATEGQTPVIQ